MGTDERKTYLFEVGCYLRRDDAIASVKHRDKTATIRKETVRSFKVTTKLPREELRKLPHLYELNEI